VPIGGPSSNPFAGGGLGHADYRAPEGHIGDDAGATHQTERAPPGAISVVFAGPPGTETTEHS